MKINEAIEKYYDKLSSMVAGKDTSLYLGYCGEDVLHNALITAMKKCGDKEMEEEEALRYLKHLIYTEKTFSYLRSNTDILVITDTRPDTMK